MKDWRLVFIFCFSIFIFVFWGQGQFTDQNVSLLLISTVLFFDLIFERIKVTDLSVFEEAFRQAPAKLMISINHVINIKVEH